MMNSQTLTPFTLGSDLSLLRSITEEKTAADEQVITPKKMRKKVLDRKLASLATAPVKPVAGVNAGPAKTASRASRKGDLALLRRTTKVKTASMQKTAYMEKRAAVKRGLAQVLEKNSMIKEAAIQLMVKEAFMCELYRIAEETGDWRIRHSLAFQEERLVAEFEKIALVGGLKAMFGAGKVLASGVRGAGKGMWAAKWGSKLKGMKGGYQAGAQARVMREGLVGGPGGRILANPGLRKTVAAPAHAGPKMTREFEQAQSLGRRRASKQLSPQTSPNLTTTGQVQYARGTGVTPAGMNPAQTQAFKQEARVQKQYGKTTKSTRSQSRLDRKDLRAAYKEQALGGGHSVRVAEPGALLPANLAAPQGLSNKALRKWKASPEGKKVLAERAVWMKQNKGGAVLKDPKQLLRHAPGSEARIASQREIASQVAKKGTPQYRPQLEMLAKERAAARAAGVKPPGPIGGTVGGGGVRQVRPATPAPAGGAKKPAGDPAAGTKPVREPVVKDTAPVKPVKDTGGGRPGSPPPPEGAGPGFLGGETFTKGTMPTWMPQGVSNKWAALTPEQRRLWAIGGMAGAGGLTAGAIVG